MEPLKTPHENSLKAAILQQNTKGDVLSIEVTKNLADAINRQHKHQKTHPDHKYTLIPNWELVQRAIQAIPIPPLGQP